MPPDQHNFSEPVTSVLAGYPNLELPLLRSELRPHPRLDWVSRQPAAELFPGARYPDCAFGGLLLLLGGWEASHETVQDIEGQEGSYWHGIAHRMEPDITNSGYWFRRVGQHSIFEPLREGAAGIVAAQKEVRSVIPAPWDPFAFSIFCERAVAAKNGAEHRIAVAIQSLEWRMLFEWCAAPDAS